MTEIIFEHSHYVVVIDGIFYCSADSLHEAELEIFQIKHSK